MNIKIKRQIERQILEDVFVNALEGGSNYWYWLPEKEVLKIRKAVTKKDEPCLSVALFKAVVDHGVEVDIYDREDEGELLGTISIHSMERRLQSLSDNNLYAWALDLHLREDGDANSADVIFQYIALNEVIYG